MEVASRAGTPPPLPNVTGIGLLFLTSDAVKYISTAQAILVLDGVDHSTLAKAQLSLKPPPPFRCYAT